MKTFLGVGGLLIAVAGIVIPLLVQSEESTGTVGGSSDSRATTSPVSPPILGTQEPSSSDADAGVEVGDCLSATHAPLPCDGPHVAEVIGPASDCSKSTLVRYLGGLAEIDVLTPEAAVATQYIGSSSFCVVQKSAGSVLTTYARDAFVDGRGDEWRWCIDDRSARTVACSQPHTAEVISEPSLQGENLNCRRRADQYAATDLSQYAFDLAVSPRGPEEAQQCVIEVRTNSVLTTSLRGLRSGSLPIESAGQESAGSPDD